MISFEQALSELLSLAKQLESEMASIEDASGRILASDAIATHNPVSYTHLTLPTSFLV